MLGKGGPAPCAFRGFVNQTTLCLHEKKVGIARDNPSEAQRDERGVKVPPNPAPGS